jgi:hypothetical protein
MFDTDLAASVERLAEIMHTATDDALGRPWAWGDYDGEGVRFTALVAYGQLRELAALAAAERIGGRAPSLAQRLLGDYHAAFVDLQALLIGLDEATAERAPAKDEWPVREALGHIVDADAGFYAMVRTNIERHRAGTWNGERAGEDDYIRILGPEADFIAALGQPLAGLRAFHAQLHTRILADLADISDAECGLPAKFWEGTSFPVRYRLQRFDAHVRQHTIQIEKTLEAIGRPPTEGSRLARLLYAALAAVEAGLIGAPEAALGARAEAAGTIADLADQALEVLAV